MNTEKNKEIKVDKKIIVKGRHINITPAIKNYAVKKINNINLEYPRIIEAKVILEVEKNHQQFAEIILFCSNHITIEASSITDDLYASIDETIAKITRRMRKYKTRILKSHRSKKSIRNLSEEIYSADILEQGIDENLDLTEDITPLIIHEDNYQFKTLTSEDAILELELGEKPFIIFHGKKRKKNSIMYKRKEGDYGLIELP